MKKVITLLLLIVGTLVIFSCAIGNPDDILINSYVWFIPGWIPNKTTNVYIEYYAPNVNTNEVEIPDTFYLNFVSEIKIPIVVEKQSNKFSTPVIMNTESLEFPYYYSDEISVKCFIKQPLESEVEVANQTFHIPHKELSTNLYLNVYLDSGEFSMGNAVLRIVIEYFTPYYTSNSYTTTEVNVEVKKTITISKGTTYYVATIPITNSMSNFANTAIYLYKKGRENNFIRIAEDFNSGYSNKMARISTELIPGEYVVKVILEDTYSNVFGIYFGKTEILSNTDTVIDFSTNTTLDTAIELIEGIPTNSFLSSYFNERYYKFSISN